MSQSLTLSQAAELTGVSITTLRRRIDDDTLRPEPRQSSRHPYLVTIEALTEAGLSVQPALTGQPALNSQPVASGYSDARAELLAERVGALEIELREVRARADLASELVGEVRAQREMIELLTDRLAIQANSQVASQPESEVIEAVSTPSRPPVRRKWWQRGLSGLSRGLSGPPS